MLLYNNIIRSIKKGLTESLHLNEMAKNISNRTIDRKLWLSVASVCSRNKNTEAEFIKPMSKLTKDELLNRYVAGLLIMKKPCPTSESDIESLKTLKLLGLKAILLGATIKDIQSLYAANGGTVSGNTNTSTPVRKRTTSTHVSTPSVNTPRVSRAERKEQKLTALLDSLIENLPVSMYRTIRDYDYKLEDTKEYLAVKPALLKYVKSLIRKSHGSFETFGQLLQSEFNEYYNMMGITADGSYNKNYVYISHRLEDRRRGYDYYSRRFCIQINMNEYKMFIEECRNSMKATPEEYTYEDEHIFDNPTSYSPGRYEDPVNLIDALALAIFKSLIRNYVLYKIENGNKANAKNSSMTLKKYHMSENGAGDFTWLKQNLMTILKNNPDIIIGYDLNGRTIYSDWSGGVNGFIYTQKRGAGVYLYLQSDHSDTNETDSLSNLLNCRGRYSYHSNRSGYSCVVNDTDALAEKVYDIVKNMILKGLLI